MISSCSEETQYSQETYEYLPVEKEIPWTTPIEFTEDSKTETTANGVELIMTEYTVTNPTTKAQLDTAIYAPKDASSANVYPGIILVPGGIAGKSSFSNPKGPSRISDAETYASKGFIVLIYSPEGREESTGTEQYNGYDSQDGLYEQYRFLKQYQGVDTTTIGIASFSYGVALASGMLARYQPDIKFFIEWEGPVNREYVTVGCRKPARAGSAVQEGITCNDEKYWQQREALRFVPYFSTDYFVIMQSEDDHVQPTMQHSVDINNLAIQYLPWTRVNSQENAINTKYTVETLPVLTDREVDAEIVEIMQELAE
jgi:dipeptidyl aminopeptidase/acylaminoacyl peptidase